MPSKPELSAGREDANACVTALFSGKHEHGLREVHLVRDVLHLFARQPSRLHEHGELIAGEALLGEDIEEVIAVGPHPSAILGFFASGKAARIQIATENLANHAQREWLSDVVVHAGSQAVLPLPRHCIGRNRNDGRCAA